MADETTQFLTPYEVLEETHALREQYIKRQISDQVLAQKYSFRLDNVDSAGRIPLKEYGLHEFGGLIQRMSSATPLWSNVTTKDVLDTGFTNGQGGGALARQI